MADVAAFGGCVGWLSLLVLGWLVLASGCGGDDPVLLGFSGQLTGSHADLGVQGRNGATLAVEAVNGRGGVAGRPLRLLASDDGDTAQGAIDADTALLKAGVVAIIGHMTSSQTLAALPAVAAAGGVMVSPTTATPELSGKKDNFFRVIPSNEAWGVALGRYAARQGLARVCLAGDTDNASYTDSFQAAFEQAFAEAGGETVCRYSFSSSRGADWGALLDQAAGSGGQAVVATAAARDVAALAQTMTARNTRLPLLCPTWPYTREILAIGGRSVDGIVFATSYSEENDRPEFREFARRYRERFGWPPNFAAAYAYEAVTVLAAALSRTGGEARGLGPALAVSGPQTGVISPFALDESGDVARDTFLVTIKDGRFTSVAGE